MTFVAQDQASAVVKKLRGEVTAFGSKNSGPLGGLIGGLGGVVSPALAMVGGIGAVTGVLAEATKAAIDEQESIDRLNVSLKDNVPGWKGTTDAMEGTIKAGEKLAFNADEQRDALAQLLTRTHDVGKATALLATAEDLARFKGVDLATASATIGKVFAGNYTAANKMGIAIDKGATSTQALAQIQQAAAGQAEAYGNSTQGAMDKASIAWHDAEVSLGKGLTPIVSALADGIVTLVDDIGNLGTAFDNVHRFIDPLYARMEDLRVAAGKLDPELQKFIEDQQAGKAATDSAVRSLAVDIHQRGQAGRAIGEQRDSQGELTAAQKEAAQTQADLAAATDAYHDDLRETNRFTAMNARATADAARVQADAAAVVRTAVIGSLNDQINEQHAATLASQQGAHAEFQAAQAKVTTTRTLFRQVLGIEAGGYGQMISDATSARLGVVGAFRAMDGGVKSALQTMLSDAKTSMDELHWVIEHPNAWKHTRKELEKEMAEAQKALKRAIKDHQPEVIAQAQKTIDGIQADLDKLPGIAYGAGARAAANLRAGWGGTVNLGVTVSGGGTGLARRAAGGPVHAGVPYIVGEHRPEVFVPSQNGTILPSVGGGNRPIHVHFHVGKRELAHEIFNELDAIGGLQNSLF